MLKEKGLVDKHLFESKNDFGENAGIVFGLFLAPKVKYCTVMDEKGILSQKTTFKGFNQNINDITFEDFLDLEQRKTLKNISKLKWNRELPVLIHHIVKFVVRIAMKVKNLLVAY